VAPGAAGRLEQRVKGAVKFSLGPLEVAKRQFLPAVLKMLVGLGDQESDWIGRRRRREFLSRNRRGRLWCYRDGLLSGRRGAACDQKSAEYRHDREGYLAGHSSFLNAAGRVACV
jgi:hypothetical protein